jgi:uncharacterized protein YneF (UPF0154 family)
MKEFIINFWKKQKIKIILAIVIAILTGIIGFGFSYFQKKLDSSIDKNNRLTEIILNKTIQYKDEMGRLVTETTEQRVTIEEYEAMISSGNKEKSELKKQVEMMGIKLKKVESMGDYKIETKYDSIPVLIYLTDSTEIDSISDGYVNLVRKRDTSVDTAIYNISVKDTLIWSINWYFLDKWKFKNIFIWRTKYYKLDAKLMNPRATINYSQFYKFPKKKKKDRR